jgi:hypothetical protein
MADLAFKFLRGAEGNLPVNGTDGHLYLTEDKHRLYASVAGKVVPVGQGVVKVANFEALASVTGAIAGEFYLCEAENLLVIYNGKEFVLVAVDTGMTSVEIVGEGNAVTAALYDAATRKLTLTKGETFATKAYVGDIPNDENGSPMASSIVAYINKKTSGIATSDSLEALATRVTTAEGEIDALQEAAKDHATKTELADGVKEAKDYADGLIEALPEPVDYTVTIAENTADTTVAKTYVFSQNGKEIGSIKLAKELVVTSGSVKEVETVDVPYAGAKIGDKYIELVIANQEAPIYVPAKDLVDIYTAKDGAAEVQVAISNTNEISATLVSGGVTEEKLAEGVKTKLNKTWEEIGVAAGLVATEKTEREAAVAGAKKEASDQAAVVLAEAEKYTDTAIGNVYTKKETYTKEEVTALVAEALTWGTF